MDKTRSSRRAVIAGALALGGAPFIRRASAQPAQGVSPALAELYEKAKPEGEVHHLGARLAVGAVDPGRVRQALPRREGHLAGRPAGELAPDRRIARRPPCDRRLDLLARRHARGPEARPAGEIRLAQVRRRRTATSSGTARRSVTTTTSTRRSTPRPSSPSRPGAAPVGRADSTRNGPTSWCPTASCCRGSAATSPSNGASSAPRNGSRR